MNRSEEQDSGTLLQLTEGTDVYVKQLRGGSKMIRHIPSDQDAATRTIIAATKTSEQHWLSELLGWALEMTEEYAANAFSEDISKRTDIEDYQLKKCKFHVQETEFLGHWITTEGIQMEKMKIQAILDWPELQNTKEVQQFVGLINYYHKFLKGYLTIMGPLFKLLKKDCKFEWGQEQQEVFRKAKEAVTEEPVLAQFDAEKETIIETDTSDYAIGMSMTQPEPDGKPRPVAFHS
jgi:hypothetical protein